MKNYLFIVAWIAGQLMLASCSKEIDNLTPSPVISLGSTYVVLPQLPDTTYAVSNDFAVPYGSEAIIPIDIKAEGKIEQVDFKITGNEDYSVVNSQNIPVTTQSVPLDWVGLMTIRSGFDSETNFKFSIKLPNVANRINITLQVIDKNSLSSFKIITIFPVMEGPEVSGLFLYSQNATAADAGGVEANRKMFLASLKGIAYDTMSAKINHTMIDISYADSAGMPILVSPEYRIAATDTSAEVANLNNSLTTKFIESSIDLSDATLPEILSADLSLATSYIKIMAGKSYIFKNSSGSIGIIKVNSISNGSVSLQANAVIEVDYKVYIPLQQP